MVARAFAVHQPVEQKGGRGTENQGAEIVQDGKIDVAGGGPAPLHRLGHGRAGAEGQQGDRVVERHDLQDEVDERPCRAILPDSHDGGSRSRGRADRAEQQGKRHRQAENEDHGQGDEYTGGQGFTSGQDQDFPAALFQLRPFEIFSDAKGDEGKRDVGNESHPADHIRRDQPEYAGADQDPGQDITGDVGQMQPFCHPRDQKTGRQHNGQRQDGASGVVFNKSQKVSPQFLGYVSYFLIICGGYDKIK